MQIRIVAVAVVLGASLTVGTPSAVAVHDADVNDAEFKCQFKTETIAWKNFAKRIACVVSCQRDARAASQPPNDCVPSFAGSTQGCVNGVNGKSQSGICKACNPDAPECYPSAPTCPDLADALLAQPQGDADDLMADVYCDDSGSGDGLTELEARCQDSTGKLLAKFGARKGTCLAKCHRLEHRGSTPPGSCPNDALGKTTACISKIEQTYPQDRPRVQPGQRWRGPRVPRRYHRGAVGGCRRGGRGRAGSRLGVRLAERRIHRLTPGARLPA